MRKNNLDNILLFIPIINPDSVKSSFSLSLQIFKHYFPIQLKDYIINVKYLLKLHIDFYFIRNKKNEDSSFDLEQSFIFCAAYRQNLFLHYFR